MARKSLWNRIKDWFTGGSKSPKSSTTTRSTNSGSRSTGSYYGGGGGSYSSYSKQYAESEEAKRKHRLALQKKAQKNTTDSLASISKRADSLSSGAKSATNNMASTASTGRERVVAKIALKSKESATKKPEPKDPKMIAVNATSSKAHALIDKEKKNRAEINKATDNRYNTKQSDKRQATLARQRIKSGDMAADATVENIAFKQHPVASMAGRKAASGMSFGISDLVDKKTATGKRKETYDLYEKTAEQHPVIAGASELAGGMVGFGLTGGLTDSLGAKAVNKFAPNAAEKLAEKQIIKKAATRSVDKAVKKGLVSDASEELIKQVGKDRATKIVNALGADVVQNLTTGALYDVNSASTRHEVGSPEWWKELGESAAFNLVATGGVAGINAFGGGKELVKNAANKVDARNALKDLADSRAGASKRVAPRIGESIDDKISRLDLENAAERESVKAAAPNENKASVPEVANKLADSEVAPKNVGYHAGDLGKAERYGNFAGGSRGTGHYGTGTYFAGSDDILKREGYGNRPIHQIDFDGYNLYRPASAEEGLGLHSSLKNINNNINGYLDYKNTDFDALRTDRDALRAFAKKGNEYDVYRRDAEYARDQIANRTEADYIDLARKTAKEMESLGIETSDAELAEMVERYKQSDREFLESFDVDNNALNRIEADLDDIIEKRRGQASLGKEGLDEIHKFFPDKSREEIQDAFDATVKQIEGYRALGSSDLYKADSASTIFMKNLGYEGVDVRGIDGLDNTEYGSVIYDLKNANKEAPSPTKNARIDNSDYAVIDESMPSTDPKLTAENEARADLNNRVREIAGGDDIRTNVIENAPPGNLDANAVYDALHNNNRPISDTLPSGARKIKSAYEYVNGEKLKGGTMTMWDEAWKASLEYSASHATGKTNRLSKVAVSQLNAMDSDTKRAIRQQLVDSGYFNYDVIRSSELYDQVAEEMRTNADYWVKSMININEGGTLDFRNTPEWQARVQYILGTVDPSADTASEIAYTEAFKLAQIISSKGGQTLNLRKNFVHLTSMGKRDALLDDFIDILNKSFGFRKEHPALNSLDYFDQRNYIRKFLMEDEYIMAGVKRVINAGSEDEVSEMFAELMRDVNLRNPKATFDIVQEIRYLNMLGNPKTHIRNVFGSSFFAPIRQVSNAVRAGLEDSIVKYANTKNGNTMSVTKHGGLSITAAKEAWAKNPTTEAGKAALEAFDRMKGDILGSEKYGTVAYTGRSKTSVGKVIDKLSDFNSNLLSGEDDFFRTRAFKESYIKSYNRYLKDGKPITDNVKKLIEAEALKESQIATFNEYNKFAEWLNNIERKGSDANAGTLERWIGRGANAIMPFTKVPANLMKESINYSPVGIAKGFFGIKEAAKKGDSELLNKAIDELSSGLTGTGIFGLGMLLGKTTDMFTTNAGKNDPAAKFKKDRGMQNYSVTFKDSETGKGYSFTLDWLVPTSATFFSGVEMAKQLNDGDFNVLDIGGSWSTVMTRLAEPVMETSMLSGLNGMLETMRNGANDDDSKGAIGVLLRETTQSYISSLVPTLASQIGRTAYKSDMQIAGDDDWEYFWNTIKSKAGLANTNILGEPLGADTDAYGNIKGEKNGASDRVKAGLKNFLSPANIQRVDFSEVDNAKLAEYEKRVSEGESPEDLAYLFPRKQYRKSFKLADEDVKMSNRDLSTYNQAKTTGGEEGMRFVLENIMFNRPAMDSNGKKVLSADAYTKAEKDKLIEAFKGKSMREVEEWLYNTPEFKDATVEERKKAIEGLWNLTKTTKAVASQRVGEQAVIKAQGGDVNEYNFKNELTEKKRESLQPYIDNGVLTYEEAVDFARNAGKTYYYENEDGGTSATYYNKGAMIDYLVSKGYSYKKAEALYNSFKASNAKPYNGNSYSSSRGYRRRGYRHYGHRGSSGAKAKVPKPKKITASSLKKGEALVTKSSGSALKTSVPTLKRVEAKIDLPTAKR